MCWTTLLYKANKIPCPLVCAQSLRLDLRLDLRFDLRFDLRLSPGGGAVVHSQRWYRACCHTLFWSRRSCRASDRSGRPAPLRRRLKKGGGGAREPTARLSCVCTSRGDRVHCGKDTGVLDDDVACGLVEHHLVEDVDDLTHKLIVLLLGCTPPTEQHAERGSYSHIETHISTYVNTSPWILNLEDFDIRPTSQRVSLTVSMSLNTPVCVCVCVCVTVQQLDESRNNARLRQHGGAGVVHGNCSDHNHHLQDEVIFCRAWKTQTHTHTHTRLQYNRGGNKVRVCVLWVGPAPGFSRSLRYGTRLYSFRTNSQSRSGMVRLASVPRHSRTHSSSSSSSSSARISAARSPT